MSKENKHIIDGQIIIKQIFTFMDTKVVYLNMNLQLQEGIPPM